MPERKEWLFKTREKLVPGKCNFQITLHTPDYDTDEKGKVISGKSFTARFDSNGLCMVRNKEWATLILNPAVMMAHKLILLPSEAMANGDSNNKG